MADTASAGIQRLQGTFSTEERQAVGAIQEGIFTSASTIQRILRDHQAQVAAQINRIDCDLMPDSSRYIIPNIYHSDVACGSHTEIRGPGMHRPVLDIRRRTVLRFVDRMQEAIQAENARFAEAQRNLSPNAVTQRYQAVIEREYRAASSRWSRDEHEDFEESHDSEHSSDPGADTHAQCFPTDTRIRRITGIDDNIYTEAPANCRFRYMSQDILGENLPRNIGSLAREIAAHLRAHGTSIPPHIELLADNAQVQSIRERSANDSSLRSLRYIRDAYLQFFFYIEDNPTLLNNRHFQEILTNPAMQRFREFIVANYVRDEGTEHQDHQNRDAFIARQQVILQRVHQAELSRILSTPQLLNQSYFEICAYEYAAAAQQGSTAACGRLGIPDIISGRQLTSQMIFDNANRTNTPIEGDFVNRGLIQAHCPVRSVRSSQVSSGTFDEHPERVPTDLAPFRESPTARPTGAEAR